MPSATGHTVPDASRIRIDPSAGDDHVRRSREMIGAAAGHAGGGAVAVLGCGRCAEVPAERLTGAFARVDLVDLDEAALRTARARWPEGGGAPAACVADLTGLIGPLGSTARRVAATAREPLSCLDELGRVLAEAAPRFWRPPDGGRYALVVCSGVLTQLQAHAREVVQAAFLRRFPSSRGLLLHHEPWRARAWAFARRLEDGFVRHLASLASPGGVVYLADTVRVAWLRRVAGEVSAEGCWIATRTPRLADYLGPRDEILDAQGWTWIREEAEDGCWGRLYGVDAIVYRPT